MTRVLMVAPRAVPWTGGMETHAHELAAALAASGTRVHAWAPTDPRVQPPGPVTRDLVRYAYFAQPVRGRWMLPPASLVRAVATRASDFDIVHLHSLHMPLTVTVLAALARHRTPIVVNGYWHGDGHTPAARVAHRAYQPLARKALARADRIIALTDGEAALLARDFPAAADRVTVIASGVTAPPPAPPMPAAGRVVLCVGRLEPYKGVDTAIRALPLLDPDVRLVIVGDGPDRARLAALAAQHAPGDRVQLTGRLDTTDLARWWARADAYATGSTAESFGLTLGQAISAGIPSVASDIPAHRHVAGLPDPRPAGPTVRLVPAGDPAATAAALAAALREQRTPPAPIRPWARVAADTDQAYRQTPARTEGSRR